MAATSGDKAQFTYDFGIAIAQSTVSKIVRLTGATLSLAAAYYALNSTAEKYVATVRKNTLQFGGQLSTMKAMEDAQKRLLSGQMTFSVDDQLQTIKTLRRVGLDVGKELDFISKAASATGQSMTEFSGAVASAIAGNMQQLVDMGLLTQRAARYFDKYTANTVMRQRAIMDFLKNNKSLLAAIRNSFGTIQGQMSRIRETWTAFLQSIVGKPNDPSSFYGQAVGALRVVADSLAKILPLFQRAGYVIGSVLGWVMKQAGNFVTWLGRKFKSTINFMMGATDNYVEFTRSLIVWLEFWKVKIVSFFREYKDEIKLVLKLVLAYKALKWAFLIGEPIIASVFRFAGAIAHCIKLQKAYIAFQGPWLNKFGVFMQSFAAWLPRPFRKSYVAIGKGIGMTAMRVNWLLREIGKAFLSIGKLMFAPFKMLGVIAGGVFKVIFNSIGAIGSGLISLFTGSARYAALFKSFTSGILGGLRMITGSVGVLRTALISLSAVNPLAWIVIAIALIAVLYRKFEGVRVVVNNFFKLWWEWLKAIWNYVYGAFLKFIIDCKKTWAWLDEHFFTPIGEFFTKVGNWISDMWNSFKDSTVGKWINEYIVKPIEYVYDLIKRGFSWLGKFFSNATDFLSDYNTNKAEQIRAMEQELGIKGHYGAAGQSYDYNDSTDYIGKGIDAVSDAASSLFGSSSTPANPISEVQSMTAPAVGGGGGVTNNYSLASKAVEVNINVDKGQDIDEGKLARMVRSEFDDILREKNMRGGTI